VTPYLKTGAREIIDRIASAAKITLWFSFSGRMSLAPHISVIADDWCNPCLQSCLRALTATDTSMIPPWRFSVSRKMTGCAPIFFFRCGARVATRFSRVHALYERCTRYSFPAAGLPRALTDEAFFVSSCPVLVQQCEPEARFRSSHRRDVDGALSHPTCL
jgi:hypothetical protein